MELKRIKAVLQKRFLFRAVVFILALLGCVGYVFLQKYNNVVWSFILGISGSALVWAAVELFDFFVQTYHQYCKERAAFLIMTNEYFSKVKELIRKDTVNIPWNEVQAIWDELWEKVARHPFVAPVYCLSKEFDEAGNYIQRIDMKLLACFTLAENGELNPGTLYEQMLYSALISVEKQAEQTSATIFNMGGATSFLEKMAKEEASFAAIEIPDQIIYEGEKGNLGEQFSIPGNIHTYTTFRPSLDFEIRFDQAEEKGALKTVFPLIFGKDPTEKKEERIFSRKRKVLSVLIIGTIVVVLSLLDDHIACLSWPCPNTFQTLGGLLIALGLEDFVKYVFYKINPAFQSPIVLIIIALIPTVIVGAIEEYGSECLQTVSIFLHSVVMSLWILAVDLWVAEKKK